MTKEEIIGGLQFTIDMFLFNPNTGENREEYELNDMDKTTIEACKGAIELLEQEPTAKNGLGIDAVNRQAVRDAIFEECSGTKLDIDFAKVLLLQRAIRALPPATPQEPKTGHWIVEIWNNREHHTCSECNHVVDYEPCYHYCPFCGCLMEGEE